MKVTHSTGGNVMTPTTRPDTAAPAIIEGLEALDAEWRRHWHVDMNAPNDVLAEDGSGKFHLREAADRAAPADVLAAAEEVRRHVTVGVWYDDPANDRGGPAVARLHDAERAVLRLYGVLGLPLGDHFADRAAPADRIDWELLWRAMRLAASDWPLPMNPRDLRAAYNRLREDK